MIYLIITTSILENDKNSEHRKKRYIESINKVLHLIENINDIKPIIVENNGKRDTFLDDFKCDILYTNNNTMICKHKGVKELQDIKDVINNYKINDNDIVIKLTGRYKIINDIFFKIILQNTQFDAYLKFFNVCTLKFHPKLDDCILGLFAIRSAYLKKFKYNCLKSPEQEFADFVKINVKPNKLVQIKNLNLECCFADDLRILKV